MLDIGFFELLVVMLLAIVIIGPKDLPKVLRTAGQWLRKLRSASTELHRHMDDIVREADLQDLRDDVQSLRKGGGRDIPSILDPDQDIEKMAQEINQSVMAQDCDKKS
jgi:sec-independent protein translocase protein TatB